MGIKSLLGMDSGTDIEMILRPGQSRILNKRPIRIAETVLFGVEGAVIRVRASYSRIIRVASMVSDRVPSVGAVMTYTSRRS